MPLRFGRVNYSFLCCDEKKRENKNEQMIDELPTGDERTYKICKIANERKGNTKFEYMKHKIET